MAISNRDRVGRALDQLRDGLLAYISRELYQGIGSNWQVGLAPNTSLQDVSVLLKLFMEHWHAVFKRLLGQADRSYVSELLDARNRWAHQEAFSSEDTDRTLDTAARLCRNIAAPEPAEAIRRLREELQQQVFNDRARNRTRYQVSIENQVQAGLLPWREVITPHPDVTAGKYQQAEFAADLDQVRRGIGSKEYTDPGEFYRRTFITSGMRALLRIALERLNGQGGEPVIELTNFGGGKTHSIPQPGPVAAKLPTTYTASVKLDSVTAGPQVGKFLDEVMSHLQALPGVNIAMTLEVQVRAPGGIDEATARIVLENSAALKVEKPGLY